MQTSEKIAFLEEMRCVDRRENKDYFSLLSMRHIYSWEAIFTLTLMWFACFTIPKKNKRLLVVKVFQLIVVIELFNNNN